jgi:methylmalonyl-CoA mutase cobalamin-binding subunit
VTVAGEHFVSAAVQRRLAAAFAAAGRSAGGPTVLVGLARGSRHELGVLAFATALRRAGLGVVYVGADLPPTDWVSMARSRDVAAVVVGVPSPEDVPAVRETVEALAAGVPEVPVLLGGGHQSAVGGPARPLGHAVGPAARELAESLRR